MKKVITILVLAIVVIFIITFFIDKASALRVLTVDQGGTSTSTAPDFNYILMGNGGGVYDVVPFSLAASSTANWQINASGWLTPTTSIPVYIDGFTTSTKGLGIPDTTDIDTGVIRQGGVSVLNNFGTGNLYIGKNSGNFTQSGANYNLGIGENSLSALTVSDFNVAIGNNTLTAITSQRNNIAIGYSTLQNSTAISNTAVGSQAMVINTTGLNNVVMGLANLYYNTSGSGNTAIGTQSATHPNDVITTNANVTGSNNTYLGYRTGQGVPSATQLDYSVAIGSRAVVSRSNSMTLGGVDGDNSVFVGIATSTPGYGLVIATSTNPAFDETGYFQIASPSDQNIFIVDSAGDVYMSGTATSTKSSGGWGSRLGGISTDAFTKYNYVSIEEWDLLGAVNVPALKFQNLSLPAAVAGASPYVGGIYQGLYLLESDASGLEGTTGQNNGNPVLTWVGNAGAVAFATFATTTDQLFFEEASGYIFDNNVTTTGRLHVQLGVAGTSPGWEDAIDLAIFENDSAQNGAVQIFTANDKIAGYFFSDPDQRNKGGISYQHSVDTLYLNANEISGVTIDNTGAVLMLNSTTTGVITMATTTDSTHGAIYVDDTPLIHFFGAAGGNMFIGKNAGNFTMTGKDNTGIGANALSSNTVANLNTALGANALSSGTSASNNTAFGNGALQFLTTANANTAVGNVSLNVNQGTRNTAVGHASGYYSTTGNRNTFIGWHAGGLAAGLSANANTIGSDNTYIGYQSGASVPSATGLTYATAIGSYAVVGCSNCMTLGGIDATHKVKVGIGTDKPVSQLEIRNEALYSGSERGISVSQYGNQTGAATYKGYKARGTYASPEAVTEADDFYSIVSYNHDGTDFLATGKIALTTGGAISTGHVPTDFVLSVSDSTISSITSDEKLRVKYTGQMGLATSTPKYAFVIATSTNAIFGEYPGFFQVASSTNQNIFTIDTDGDIQASRFATTTPRALCPMTDGTIGYCSDAVAADGTCTCNAY